MTTGPQVTEVLDKATLLFPPFDDDTMDDLALRCCLALACDFACSPTVKLQ